jgi:16S rRNA (guanine966-N2)-methyltransferase
VREATCNALGSLGAVEGAAVLDLFAGSGALGIETLSRGAASCTFVDQDRRAIAAVRANLQTCGLADRAEVVRSTAERFLAAALEQGRRWDLALLDPPYQSETWAELLTSLPADVVVVESDRAVDLPAEWVELRSKRYGSTVVSIAEHRPADG